MHSGLLILGCFLQGLQCRFAHSLPKSPYTCSGGVLKWQLPELTGNLVGHLVSPLHPQVNRTGTEPQPSMPMGPDHGCVPFGLFYFSDKFEGLTFGRDC